MTTISNPGGRKTRSFFLQIFVKLQLVRSSWVIKQIRDRNSKDRCQKTNFYKRTVFKSRSILVMAAGIVVALVRSIFRIYQTLNTFYMKNLSKNAFCILLIKKLRHYFFLAVILLFTSNFSKAQNNWSLTLRTGANFPTKHLGDTNLKTGFGLGGTIAYPLIPFLNFVAGWDWNRFPANESLSGSNTDLKETGYNAGLQLIYPIEEAKLTYWVGGSGIYNHIQIENNKGDIIAASKDGWGWQIDAGLSFRIATRWNLLPGLRYRSLSRDIKTGESSTPTDLKYVSLGVGLSWLF